MLDSEAEPEPDVEPEVEAEPEVEVKIDPGGAEAASEVKETKLGLQPAHRVEALDMTAQIELQYALLRDRHYIEKIDDLAMEEAMVEQLERPSSLKNVTETIPVSRSLSIHYLYVVSPPLYVLHSNLPAISPGCDILAMRKRNKQIRVVMPTEWLNEPLTHPQAYSVNSNGFVI